MTASIADYAETQTAKDVINKFLDWVEVSLPLAGQTVLEIGCGAGHSTIEIITRLGEGRLTAIEPDDQYRREAAARLRKSGLLGRTDLVKLRAQDLKYEPGLYTDDLFIWANGIHYLEEEADLTSFLKVTRSLCNNRGFFCTSFWQGSVSMRDFAVLGRMTRFALEHLGLDPKGEGVPKSRRLHEWSLADYERFAREAGYERVEIVQVPMQLPVGVYQGIAHDVTWVDNALPPEGKLAAFSREERIEALVVGAQKAYEAAGVETTQRIWAFVRVA